MRRDPVPEMVWTVMLCWEEKSGLKTVGFDLSFIKFGAADTQTYPAALQHLIISTKSQLGAGLGKLPQTTNGKVLLIQLFGCNQSLCLDERCRNQKVLNRTEAISLSIIPMFIKHLWFS